MFSIDATESKSPLWASAFPGFYMFAAGLCVLTKVRDPSAEIGIWGLLVGACLVPAFVVPAVFSTRRVRLAVSEAGLHVDGRRCKIDDLRIEDLGRHGARIHVVFRDGEARTFQAASTANARKLAAQLPPNSVPAHALPV
ncbi:hypothetical protein AKJ09_09263 [Labilithrix luteola]|uniref:Uncharacterized protein n=1 Tax=Labilithrix luteola TaxID=1391654 RepID=A0A0K1QB06_9BACT|nr:hypothetical protein AKJ09_09263 [Labilithrix luteola]